ncbi:hypothetical protein I7I53_05711 [Histoplasma capsulatum var. duboisii H88]|uniref:Uncharacterized protein n=1 Tax=Ajellomyces capsulatus (strain H88) TaxID=544711 RepID=A0A8A1LTM5_AJEC8|nr:hypothetical protein I7I53_05711 [Histoplasma capsulatum var. duboisii H88]
MGARRVSGRRERISPVPGRETLACMAGSDVALMGFSSYIPISYRPAKNLYCHFKAQPQRVSTQGVQLSQKSPFTDLQLPAFRTAISPSLPLRILYDSCETVAISMISRCSWSK